MAAKLREYVQAFKSIMEHARQNRAEYLFLGTWILLVLAYLTLAIVSFFQGQPLR